MKLLQVPEGLRTKALEIADEIGDVLIYGERCYGACDLPIHVAKDLGCEKIIHYGHSKFMDSEIPVEYREIREDYDPVPVLKTEIEKVKQNRIGLVSALQFLDSLERAKELLEAIGKKVLIGKGSFDDGQILGCDISAAKSIEKDVDAFLYIGSGRFHPLGLALETDKPVFVLDVEKQEIADLKEIKEKFMKQRYTAVALSKDAEKFGILVSVKPGQLKLDLAKKIKEDLIKKGKKAYIIVFDEINADKLEGYGLDCYINTACPRIVIENRTTFKKPILNSDELELL